jgi:hypothetical protein
MSRFKRVSWGAGDRLRALTKKWSWVADDEEVEKRADGDASLLEAYRTIRSLFELFVEVDNYVGNVVGMTEAMIEDESIFRQVILGTPEGSELIAHLRATRPELFRKMEEERGYRA